MNKLFEVEYLDEDYPNAYMVREVETTNVLRVIEVLFKEHEVLASEITRIVLIE